MKHRPDSHISTIPSLRSRKSTPSKTRNLERNINGLPVELLSHIFEFGVGSNEHEDLNVNAPQYWDGIEFHSLERREDGDALSGQIPIKTIENSPHILGRRRRRSSFRITVSLVCSHWYRVAISTPSLWTSLRLSAWHSFEHYQAMVARSGRLPLHLDVWYYIETSSQEFDAEGSDSESDDDLKPLPRLENEYIILFGDLLPRVRTLILFSFRLSWSGPWLSSLSNLTTLELCEAYGVRPSLIQLTSLLRATPALKKLALCYAGPFFLGDTVAEGDHVPLLSLTDLILRAEGPECTAELLCMLYMPVLKRLSLDLRSSDDSTFTQLLAGPATLLVTHPADEEKYSLLSRLEHLRIACLNCGNNLATLQRFYDGLHNLMLLQLSARSKPPKLLEHLQMLLPYYSHSGQGNVLVRLPRLETLIISEWVGTLTFIRQIVEKRKAAGFPVRNLHIHTPYNEDLKWLEGNVEMFSLFCGGHI